VRKQLLVLVLVAALAACGDDIRQQPGGDGGGSDGSDAQPPATLTTFVIDLIKNQTADNTAPRPFADFSTLPDPDGDNNNVDAYKSLFQ
jgi:hypothetical protein